MFLLELSELHLQIYITKQVHNLHTVQSNVVTHQAKSLHFKKRLGIDWMQPLHPSLLILRREEEDHNTQSCLSLEPKEG